jgi:hypothetical protein
MPASATAASKENTNEIYSFVNKAAPPTFTFPVLALKAFLPSPLAVFVLGALLCVLMYFRAPKIGVTEWYNRFLVSLTCFAWLLIIDEAGADILLSKFILGNSVDDHTYIIKFVAGAIILFHMFLAGIQPTHKQVHAGGQPS